MVLHVEAPNNDANEQDWNNNTKHQVFFTNAALIVTIVAVVVTYDSKSLVDLMVIWLDWT